MPWPSHGWQHHSMNRVGLGEVVFIWSTSTTFIISCRRAYAGNTSLHTTDSLFPLTKYTMALLIPRPCHRLTTRVSLPHSTFSITASSRAVVFRISATWAYTASSASTTFVISYRRAYYASGSGPHIPDTLSFWVVSLSTLIPAILWPMSTKFFVSYCRVYAGSMSFSLPWLLLWLAACGVDHPRSWSLLFKFLSCDLLGTLSPRLSTPASTPSRSSASPIFSHCVSNHEPYVAFLACEGFFPQGFPHTKVLMHPDKHDMLIPNILRVLRTCSSLDELLMGTTYHTIAGPSLFTVASGITLLHRTEACRSNRGYRTRVAIRPLLVHSYTSHSYTQLQPPASTPPSLTCRPFFLQHLYWSRAAVWCCLPSSYWDCTWLIADLHQPSWLLSSISSCMLFFLGLSALLSALQPLG